MFAHLDAIFCSAVPFLVSLLKAFGSDSKNKWFDPTVSFLLDSKDYENNISKIKS